LGEHAKETKDKDMESVMNGGDKKGALVERCELDLATKNMRPRKFAIYSPKMICNVVGGLASDTMRSRCITVIMQKALHDVLIEEPDSRNPEFVSVRCGLYRYMMAHWKDVQKAYLESDYKGNRRAVTIWKPLVVMAGMVGDDMKKELLDYMEIALKNAKFDEGGTEEARLLERLHDIVTEKRYYTFSEISGIQGMDLRWQDYSDRKLGLMLRKLGLASDKKHTRTGEKYMLSPEKISFEMMRFGIGIVEQDEKGEVITPPFLSLTASQPSQASHGEGSEACEAVRDKIGGVEASLRPSDQTSLSEVKSDNNGIPSQIVEVQNDKPEPSRWLPEKEWNEVGKCSSCGVNNQTTMHEGVQLCKLCYFQIKSDELEKG